MSNTKRLRMLLNGAKSDHDLTLDKVVERGAGQLRRSTVHNLLTQENREHPLAGRDLRVIAAAFGVEFEALRQAHLADMDLLPEGAHHAPPMNPALNLPPDADRLTKRQRAAVVAVVRAMLEPAHAATMKFDPDVVALEAEADDLRAELAPRTTNGPRGRRR